MRQRLFARWTFRYTDTAQGAYRMTLRADLDAQGPTLGGYEHNVLAALPVPPAHARIEATAKAQGYTIVRED